MRIVHLIQPASCPAPPWPCADQRADVPCHIVAALAAAPGIGTHEAIVIGGSQAAKDAAVCGLTAPHIAPLMGQGLLGVRALSARLRSLAREDVVIGWGTQFRRVLDLARPRSAKLVVDLCTGELAARSQIAPEWESLGTLPARVPARVQPTPARVLRVDSGAISVGLCDDGPTIAPTVAFSFALGVIAATGFNVTPVIRRGTRDLARLVRHTREGGRLQTPIAFDGPLSPRALKCDWWLCSLPSRSTQTDPPYTDWSTLLLADLLAVRGANVLGVGDGCTWLDESLAPRIQMVGGHALSHASSGLMRALAEGGKAWTGPRSSDVCEVLNAAASRISRGESAHQEHRHAG